MPVHVRHCFVSPVQQYMMFAVHDSAQASGVMQAATQRAGDLSDQLTALQLQADDLQNEKVCYHRPLT